MRTFLRGEVETNVRIMGWLRNEVKELLSKDLKKSSAVGDGVTTHIERKIRAGPTRSGTDVSFIAEAMTDLRGGHRELEERDAGRGPESAEKRFEA